MVKSGQAIIYESNASRYEEMLENSNVETISNYLTSGGVTTLSGALNPDEPLSFDHWMSSLGVAITVYGGYKMASSAKGAVRVQPSAGADSLVDDVAEIGTRVKNKNPREINIHGKVNSELDEVDLINKIIYEDKSAVKLYMKNPNVPQTEQQWANKQILGKGGNRIDALKQSEFRLSSSVSENIPSLEEIKTIKNYVFRIDADTPALREAVENALKDLSKEYPDYDFSAIYGGKK